MDESRVGSIESCAVCSRQFVVEVPRDKDGSENRKFDWISFQVRFICGAVLGALFGWRVWIRAHFHTGRSALLFDYTARHEWSSLYLFMGVGALLVGIVGGVAWREDFWSRPL